MGVRKLVHNQDIWSEFEKLLYHIIRSYLLEFAYVHAIIVMGVKAAYSVTMNIF